MDFPYMISDKILLSVVVPIYNEETNVFHLVNRLQAVLSTLPLSYEVILVDDGSSDETWSRIVEVAHLSKVRGFRLSRNYGHQSALLAGLQKANGHAVISMDGDLQHPPELIPKMVEKWFEGYKIVLTQRIDTKKATSPFKRLTSKYFYQFLSAIAETQLEAGSSDFRLLDRVALNNLLQFSYGELFLRGAVELLGFPKTKIAFEVGERFSGNSKYTFRKMLKLARNGLISHSKIPLRIGIWLGLMTGFVALIELFYAFFQYVSGDTVPGWASIIVVTTLLFSILFIIIGIIGLYIEDIHKIIKKDPHFIIWENTGSNYSENKIAKKM